MNFPISNTRISGSHQKFDLNDPDQRKKYFELKAGAEIQKIRSFLSADKKFLAFLIGKKNSGKGTYSKLFMEAVGSKHLGHLSIGDIVRDIHKALDTERGKNGLLDFLRQNYRGFHSLEQVTDLILGRGHSTLVPSELILALIKYEVSKRPRQALFIDGFPRAHDQISYSLFLKELIGYLHEPDFFVFISLPDAIIDERIKYRVVCPLCQTPRNLRLLATKDVGYDQQTKTFYLRCDNPACGKARMLAKEGDHLGIEPIRNRLEVDDQIFQKLLSLHGAPKVYLRNSIPVAEAGNYVDDYELTPSYEYELDPSSGLVRTKEKPWVIKDDEGQPAYSLLPPAVVVSLIKQVVKVLEL